MYDIKQSFCPSCRNWPTHTLPKRSFVPHISSQLHFFGPKHWQTHYKCKFSKRQIQSPDATNLNPIESTLPRWLTAATRCSSARQEKMASPCPWRSLPVTTTRWGCASPRPLPRPPTLRLLLSSSRSPAPTTPSRWLQPSTTARFYTLSNLLIEWTKNPMLKIRLWSLARLPWCCTRFMEMSLSSLGGFLSGHQHLYFAQFFVPGHKLITIFYQGDHHQWIVAGSVVGEWRLPKWTVSKNILS